MKAAQVKAVAGALDEGRDSSSGCGCRVKERDGAHGLWALLGLGALARIRRRQR